MPLPFTYSHFIIDNNDAILRYNLISRHSGVWIYHEINQRISYSSTTQALRDELWRQLILLNDISRNHGNERAYLSRFNQIKWTCSYAKCYARCSFTCKELLCVIEANYNVAALQDIIEHHLIHTHNTRGSHVALSCTSPLFNVFDLPNEVKTWLHAHLTYHRAGLAMKLGNTSPSPSPPFHFLVRHKVIHQ